MFERISYTWDLMQASWSVLKRDKELVFFPLLSSIACLIVVGSFAAPLFYVDWPAMKGSTQITRDQQILGWAYMFAFYFVNYFVITFFNVGIIACATTRMAGGQPTFSGGIRAAFQRIHLIAAWALVSATVGLLLKMIESYNKKFGRFIAGLLGAAWTILTFLVVPVLVVEEKGPIDAIKESAKLLKQTWGSQIIGNFSFGLIFFLLFLPAIAAVVAAAYLMAAVSPVAGLLLMGLAVTYIIALALIQSTLHSIFQAALYMYTQGVTDETGAFPVKMLKEAVSPSM